MGNDDLLLTNLKKAYDMYLGIIKDLPGNQGKSGHDPVEALSYSTIAGDVQKKKQFYHGDAGVLIRKRMVL